MNQKLVLTLAATLTAFALVIGGAVIGRAGQPTETIITPTAADLQSVYTQREAEYQARLNEANAALAAAYAQQDAAAAANNAQPQLAAAQPAATQITPQDAILIANITAPSAQVLRLPELVNYQGTLAYEVTLDAGVIYVDTSLGTVLYNGTAQPQISVQTRTFEHEEHEGGHDD